MRKESTKFIIENKCGDTVWPATEAGAGTPQLGTTGFELRHGVSISLDVPPGWSGRVWARTLCSNNDTTRFRCNTGDCGSGTITCNGAGGVPPSSLVEFTLENHASNDQDFYDISLVDSFNLPVSPISCPINLNSGCPRQLAIGGSDGPVVACKSACVAFGQPQYCCTGDYGSPNTCLPTVYSKYFKRGCPQAYSYAYDDCSSTFTCSGGPNYLITFCSRH
ncbi:hypothetical protein RND81_02G179600 [Saponaria officinalis]|uniref:Thaumatin-like protein n=1 Tax=Saponaria officinalis TaxID=3572 RepID=A0AAW1MVK9_SAPOF